MAASLLTRDQPVLEVERLSKTFGGIEVVRDVSLSVQRGEILMIMGPSGAGKTTVLRCIETLEHPDRGRIVLDGREVGISKPPDLIWQPGPHKLLDRQRMQIGFVFQRFHLFANLTALENVTLGPVRVLGQTKQEARGRAMSLLRDVGLSEHVNKRPNQLSGGQQQRVAICRALAMEPKLILFDEPTSSLDPELVGEVLNTMRDLARSGMTMIVVSHEVGFAREVADRVMLMDEGQVVEVDSPQRIFTQPTHDRTRAFLRRILATHPSGNDEVHQPQGGGESNEGALPRGI